jgi:hypothetical protein
VTLRLPPLPFLLALLLLPSALPAAGGDLLTTAIPPGGTFPRGVEVALVNSEDGTIYYTVDGSEPNTDSGIYRSPIFLRTDTVLRFFAVDGQGRREPVREESYVFQLAERLLDTTAPEVQSDRPSGRYGAGEKVRLSSNEEAAIYFTLDGSEPTEGSLVFRDPIELPAGTVTLKFFAVDAAGNRSRTRQETYTIDVSTPVTTAYPTTGVFRPPLGVKLSVSKPGAVIHYTTDGSQPSMRSPVATDAIVLEGHTVLRFFAVDDVGNLETPKKEEYFFDDVVPRTVATPPAGKYPPPLAVSLGSKKGSRIFYTTDKSAPSTESPLYSAPIPVKGPLTLRFFAIDNLGNREEPQAAEYDLMNGAWSLYSRGVYMIPSVTDGKTFWMKNEAGPGVVRYRVVSGIRQILGEKEGLRGKTVNDLVLDEKGVLWAATDEGLYRFLDERFSGFSLADGLPDHEALSLGVDVDGTLWAGTPSGAAQIHGDVIDRIITARDGLPANEVLAVAVDAAGTRWFGTPKGLARWDGKTWKTFTVASGLADNRVNTVAVDAAWNVWAGGPKGLSRYDGMKWTVFTAENGLPSSDVILLTTEQSGDVWAATAGGVARYTKGKWVREERP